MIRKALAILVLAALVLPNMALPVSAATASEIDQAIQDGLAWLATQQGGFGQFGTGYPLANTATAVLAFENEGHFPGGGTAYSPAVEQGLNYILYYCYTPAINVQTYGYPGRYDDPDTNGNGKAVYFYQSSYMYETGLVMQALAASNTPDRVVTVGPCTGMTYRQVMTDLVDFLAWAQIDGGYGRGGWRYGIYNNQAGYGDNSVAQWPVLGLVAAEQWGIFAPQFVKDEMEYWVSYIQNANGGSGYDTPNSMVNIAKTGGLLVEFFYLGDDQNTPRVQRALAYVNAHWNESPYSTWYGNKGHPYAMFSVFKGLELLKVPTVPNALPSPETPAGDWWGDYSEYLVNTQTHPTAGQGYWSGYSYWGTHLATPWYIVILQASVFPVSVDIVVPDSACDETGVGVSVHYSVERFTASGTVKVYRDGVLYDTLTLTDFKGSATQEYSVAPEELGVHTWRAELEVTAGGFTARAEDTDTGQVYDTPEVSGIPDQVAPFTSFDLDNFQTCPCGDVEWSTSAVPAGWTVTIDAGNIATVIPPAEAVDPVEITFVATFHWPGIDCIGSDAAIFSPNQPPYAHPGKIYPDEKYYVYEGESVILDGSQSTDPDGDALVYYAWDLDADSTFEVEGIKAEFSAAMLDNPPDDEFYVYLKVCDEHGACDIGLAEVVILDQAPTAEFTWAPEPQDEGSPVLFTDQSSSVVDAITGWAWDFASLAFSSEQHPAVVFFDNGSYAVCLTVTDDDGSTGSICHTVTVNNVAPVVGPITAPLVPVAVNTPIIASADFSDAGAADSHTAVWNWGDGTSSAGTVTESNGSGSVSDSHIYAAAGIYTLALTVTDDDGGSGSSTFEYVVVYDPDAGFVTGGGWIWSPAGAYQPDPGMEGKATFGFVSKYLKGATVPTGQTEFQFHAAGLNFHSSSYQWLVVTGSNYARYKGSGSIDGVDGYNFMIWAGDGVPDTFRIKIWTEDTLGVETVLYDNGFDQPIASGNIVIHVKK